MEDDGSFLPKHNFSALLAHCVFFRPFSLFYMLHNFSCLLEDTELRCVPERFESMEEYVRVFEPLLFEECRAQLNRTWEELAEANAYVKVQIKSIERRERGKWP